MKNNIFKALSAAMLLGLVFFAPQAEARIYISVGSHCDDRYEGPRGHCYPPPVHCRAHYEPPCRPRYVAPPCYRPPVYCRPHYEPPCRPRYVASPCYRPPVEGCRPAYQDNAWQQRRYR